MDRWWQCNYSVSLGRGGLLSTGPILQVWYCWLLLRCICIMAQGPEGSISGQVGEEDALISQTFQGSNEACWRS